MKKFSKAKVNYKKSEREVMNRADRRQGKVKIYHDVSCNCYACRAGVSLKAKD